MKLHRLEEKELIEAIRKEFFTQQANLELGIGDDAAVIKTGKTSLVITKDLLLEDIHFLRRLHPPRLLGRKSLNVNLSDLAAMGAKPKYALLGLGIPVGTETGWIEFFFKGFKSAAGKFGVKLIGGDVTRAQKVTVSVTLIGEGKRIIKRSGAESGHHLFVSGALGEAREGLLLLKRGFKLGGDKKKDKMLKAFLDPTPQVELGMRLAGLQLVSSMIDISDGLSVDLGHICKESRCGAEIEREKLPISFELRSVQRRAFDFAMNGGEDYQLLFSVPPSKLYAVYGLKKKYSLTHIGKTIRGKGIFLIDRRGRRQKLKPRAWQHF